MGNALSQSYFIPDPPMTEENCPDQSDRVHIVTGGYSGVGLELVKILYQHNAIVYVAGRSPSKAESAIKQAKAKFPQSRGRLEFLEVDFADLTTVKPAVEKFQSLENSLHVLTLNAGVMNTPEGSKTAQGYDLQMGTNCLGSYLIYKLLHPTLVSTAKTAPPASVRVSWAGSLGIEFASPKPGGIKFVGSSNEPAIDMGSGVVYAQSKAGNLMLSSALAREDKSNNILHLCWNPGALKTDLYRHNSATVNGILNVVMNLHPPVFGAYTELFAALSDMEMNDTGRYIVPWGRVGSVRPDVTLGCQPVSQGGLGTADKFLDWCSQKTAKYQ